MWLTEQQICLEATRRTISETLKLNYEPVVAEALPDHLRSLLERLAGDDRCNEREVH